MPPATPRRPTSRPRLRVLQSRPITTLGRAAPGTAAAPAPADSARPATVAAAASVEEAIQMVAESLPNAIIADIGMPGEDGYSLIRRLRALPAERPVPGAPPVAGRPGRRAGAPRPR